MVMEAGGGGGRVIEATMLRWVRGKTVRVKTGDRVICQEIKSKKIM